MNISIELGKQDLDRGRRPAITLIKPRNNNSTYITSVIDPRNKHTRFKKQIGERFGCKATILLQGELFSRSPFVKHHLQIEEYASHCKAAPISAELRKELKDIFFKDEQSIHQQPLVSDDEPFIVFNIVRPTEQPEHVPWQDNRLHEFGLEPSFLQLLSNRNNITPKKLKQLRAEIMDLYKSKAFARTTVTKEVNDIFLKYRLYNVGGIKHRILEAGRVAVKSKQWMKLTSYFLPKYTRYLIDKASHIQAFLDALQQNIQQPDIVMYEQFPMIFSKLPWKDQVKDTLNYWDSTKTFELDERWKNRFEIYKKVFESRQMQNNTMLVTKEPITIDQDAQTLFAKNVLVNLSNIDPEFSGQNCIAFTHEYQSEEKTVLLLQTCFQTNKINMVVEGHGFQKLNNNMLIIIPNLQLKRYAYCLAFRCSDGFQEANVKVFDGNDCYSKCFGNKAYERIYLFATELWPAKMLTNCCLQLKRRQPKNIVLHLLGDNNMASYCSPRYDMKPIFRYLQGYSLDLDKTQVLKGAARKAYWFPEPQEVFVRPSQSIPNERHFKTKEEFDAWFEENVFNEENMSKQDRQSAWNSFIPVVFDDANKILCLEEMANKFGVGKFQFKLYDRVITPEGFVTQIKRISHHGNYSSIAYKQNYEDYAVFVKNPFDSTDKLYHPTELCECCVLRFQWMIGPINNVIFYGRWPQHALEEARKMVFGQIIIHPSFKVEDWNKSRVAFPRTNCYGSIIAQQEAAKQQAQQEAEQAARQEAEDASTERKKRIFAMARNREKEKNIERDKKRRKDEISSLSTDSMQSMQKTETPNTF
ncbi:MAG: hypothetical protein CBC48_09065 [bacterium TMED88]|nr:hypothetical protein [Deltaproteobacteria bacterium]OUV31920.1 MAG: hypothetical protein CBC48_09065 [bacterium TMED88]